MAEMKKGIFIFMKKINLIYLILTLTILCISIRPAISQEAPEDLMRYGDFSDILISIMNIEVPDGRESLSDDEYYEVNSNLLAENSITIFLEKQADEVVDWAEMADVVYTVSGGKEDLTTEEKISYMVRRGYIEPQTTGTAITFSDNNVEVLKKDSQEWEKSESLDGIQQGDTIKTDPDSKSTIYLKSIGRITLKEDTSLKIAKLASEEADGGKHTELEVLSGDVKVLVEGLGSDSTFKVKTPTAVCGVLGTIFYVNTDGSSTGMFVEKGNVSFGNTSGGASHGVNQGSSSNSNNQGKVTNPKAVSQEEKASWIIGYIFFYGNLPVNFNDAIRILNNPAFVNAAAENYSSNSKGPKITQRGSPAPGTPPPETPLSPV